MKTERAICLTVLAQAALAVVACSPDGGRGMGGAGGIPIGQGGAVAGAAGIGGAAGSNGPGVGGSAGAGSLGGARGIAGTGGVDGSAGAGIVGGAGTSGGASTGGDTDGGAGISGCTIGGFGGSPIGDGGGAGAMSGADGSDGGLACGYFDGPCCNSYFCGSDSRVQCLGGNGFPFFPDPDRGCTCGLSIEGRYLQLTNRTLLYEADSPSAPQLPILVAGTCRPVASPQGTEDGFAHGCAALPLPDRTVLCWRTAVNGNAAGQLGSGTADSSGPLFQASPVLTAPGQPLTDVRLISRQTSAPGGDATCAVTGDGKLYCWGDLGWLANGGAPLMAPYAIAITIDGSTPFTGAVQVAISGSFACAMTEADGNARAIWCWGNNTRGQLATGDLMPRRYPTKVLTVPAGETRAQQIIAFGSDEQSAAACLLDGDFHVRCWGGNESGQLGIGTITAEPLLAPGLVTFMDGTPLSTTLDLQGGTTDDGGAVGCANSNGQLLCWGRGLQPYPTVYGEKVYLTGNLNGTIRFLTKDGRYHVDATARTVDCSSIPPSSSNP